MAGLISNAEALGNANDVRDRFHKRLEDLCQLVDVQFEFEPVNELNSDNKAVEKLTLSIGGVNVIKRVSWSKSCSCQFLMKRAGGREGK